jgi:hypothetical protein
MRSVSSVCFDADAGLMTTRLFLNLKGSSQRSLADLHAVQVVTYPFISVHYVNLIFDSSSPPVIGLFALGPLENGVYAKDLARRIADYLGVTVFEERFKCGPSKTVMDGPEYAPGRRLQRWIVNVIVALSITAGFISGVLGVIAGGNWLGQHGAGLLAGYAGPFLFLICFSVGMMAVVLCLCGLVALWIAIMGVFARLGTGRVAERSTSAAESTSGTRTPGGSI